MYSFLAFFEIFEFWKILFFKDALNCKMCHLNFDAKYIEGSHS